jgi:hypothetical protein
MLHVAAHGFYGWRTGFAGAASRGPATRSSWPDLVCNQMAALLRPTHDLSDGLDQAMLQQTLVLAGAASQVVGLWSVADTSPPALMRIRRRIPARRRTHRGVAPGQAAPAAAGLCAPVLLGGLHPVRRLALPDATAFLP